MYIRITVQCTMYINEILTSFSRQLELLSSHVDAHKPSTQVDPAAQSELAEHFTTGWVHALVGSPLKPRGHLQTGRWFSTLQRALVPQAMLEEQGSLHWLSIQAWWAPQVCADRQPSTQVTPWQISSLLQSSSSLNKVYLFRCKTVYICLNSRQI